MQESKKDQVIELGGRKFVVVVERTLGNDNWIVEEAARVGLTSLSMNQGEDAYAFASRIMQTVVHGGALFRLLGGLLVPEGKTATDWTPEMAAETGEFLSKLTARADKDVINGATAGMLQRFFANGIASATTSGMFSPQMQAALAVVQQQRGPGLSNVNVPTAAP